jgi:hypothetical protein
MSNKQCPCDERIHPQQLAIHAGLTRIPRQIAGFPEFRRAMLAQLSKHAPLGPWRTRSEDDLGVMLLEMWAYVCDVLAFYDETIAHECYLRTARQRRSVRRLTDLLGYVPRPAVAASVLLAAFAEGRKPVTLPAGTAFRSQAFDGEPPQIFELDAETTIHPLNNEWTVAPTSQEAIVTSSADLGAEQGQTTGEGGAESANEISQLLLDPEFTDLKGGDIILLRIASQDFTAASVITALTRITGEDGEAYDQVSFEPGFCLRANASLRDIEVMRATQTASLWTMGRVDSHNPMTVTPRWDDGISVTGQDGIPYKKLNISIYLDAIYRQIKPGEHVVVAQGDRIQLAWVDSIGEHLMHLVAAHIATAKDENDNDVNVPIGPVRAPASRLAITGKVMDMDTQIEESTSWMRQDYDQTVVHYGFVEAGKVTVETQRQIDADDGLVLLTEGNTGDLAPSQYRPSTWAIEDSKGDAHAVQGAIQEGNGKLIIDAGERWEKPLVAPLSVFGNVLETFRGETVRDEVLGSGDASVAGQSFQLKKKPLTYVASPTADNDRAVASTLKVWVDGIQWEEVPTFFGVGADDAVYILRQSDQGDTKVIFGDGIRGRRLPTGRYIVMASYRFGAGAKAPPSDGITQIAKPVKGLKSVRNPLPAGGGADADSAEHIRTHGPDSALLLGRAVSIRDFEAAVAGMAGVRAVRAEWRWGGVRQGPVVKIWYVGDVGIEDTICEALRNKCDPTVTIDVDRATPKPLDLLLTIEIDSRRQEKDVFEAVQSALLDPQTGILAPENIGIEQPLYRSPIFESVLAVEGAVAVMHIAYERSKTITSGGHVKKRRKVSSFDAIALKPGTGCYFDLEDKGSLKLNRRETTNG